MLSGIYRFPVALMGVLLLHATTTLSNTQPDIPGDFLSEAKKLYAIETDYFQKRLASDWQGIYDYHHPVFKKNIQMYEFKYFHGRVLYNFREIERHKVSGLRVPSREFIRKNPKKKDILGFPIPNSFDMFGDPLISSENLVLEKIAISRDKRYAKTEGKIKGQQKLNAALMPGAGDIIIPVKIKVIDYWEKIDGRWVITLLRDTVSISGASKFYYIPDNSDRWEKMEFVSIDASLAAPDEH